MSVTLWELQLVYISYFIGVINNIDLRGDSGLIMVWNDFSAHPKFFLFFFFFKFSSLLFHFILYFSHIFILLFLPCLRESILMTKLASFGRKTIILPLLGPPLQPQCQLQVSFQWISFLPSLFILQIFVYSFHWHLRLLQINLLPLSLPLSNFPFHLFFHF